MANENVVENLTTDSIDTSNLAPFEIFCLFFAVCGFLGNAILITVILKSSLSRTRCNLLAAALAGADMLFCAFLFHTRITMLHGKLAMISSRHCFYTLSYGIFADAMQGNLNVALGVDRLLWLVKEESYDQWNTKLYIAGMLLTALLNGVIVTGLTFKMSNDYLVARCITAFAEPVIWPISNCINATIVVVCFVGAQIILKLRRGRTATVQAAPLFLVNTISIITFTYVVNFFTLFALSYLRNIKNLSARARLSIETEHGTAFVILLSCNIAFIAYFFGCEQFRRELKKLLCDKKEETHCCKVTL